MESNVRSYCRSFPVTFTHASGSHLYASGNKFLDFMTGAGTMIYGHNDPDMKAALLEYISSNGITHSLDLMTGAKANFMNTFYENILAPRGMEKMKIMFCGPTGTNGIEAAIKLARKYTGRTHVASFTNGFHGCSLGALALTGAKGHRENSDPVLTHTLRFPYDGYYGHADTIGMIDKLLSDPSGGVPIPAAIVVEAVQGEGGLNVASKDWMKGLRDLCNKHGIVMISDEVQTGVGRTGKFFAFEHSDVIPDIVVLSKGISGYGQPMTIILHHPELDVYDPAEHNGTFRGNNLAFVTSAVMLNKYWNPENVGDRLHYLGSHSEFLHERLQDIVDLSYGKILRVKGIGFMLGLECANPELAQSIKRECFNSGLILELCGPSDEVVKLMPPVNIEFKDLMEGIDIIESVTQGLIHASS